MSTKIIPQENRDPQIFLPVKTQKLTYKTVRSNKPIVTKLKLRSFHSVRHFSSSISIML